MANGTAFISDSGLGAIVVLDLKTGRTRRLLTEHPSTKAEPGLRPLIEQQAWALADGSVPEAHVDGIAIDPNHTYLSYKALRGNHLHRIPLSALLNEQLTPEALGEQVAAAGNFLWPDSITISPEGDLLFTASQFHRMPAVHGGTDQRTSPYSIFRLPAVAAGLETR